MRERLLLLSRNLFSPPNPRVSGGSSLLLGGHPLHHGGSTPLLGGSFPPHSLGLFAALPPFLTPSANLSHQPPHCRHHPPNTIPPSLAILAGCSLHHYPQKPHPIITTSDSPVPAHHCPTATSSVDLTIAPPSLLCLLLGVGTLTGNLLLHSPTTSVPMTPALRPPPEPPPPFNEKEPEVTFSPLTLLLHSLIISSASSVCLAPLRPPPKSPWPQLVVSGRLVSGQCSGALLVLWFYGLCLSNFWPKYAYVVFAESPHRTSSCLSTWVWSWLHYMETARTFGADTSSDGLSYYHLVSFSQTMGVNLETNLSRMERTQVKEIIHNWIVRKTAVSQSTITSTWELRLLIIWMLGCCVWVGYALRASKLSKCNVSNAHTPCVVVCFKDVDLRFRFGNVQPHLLHVSCNDDLVIN